MKNFSALTLFFSCCFLFCQKIEKTEILITRTSILENNQNYYVYEKDSVVILTKWDEKIKKEKLLSFCPTNVCFSYFGLDSSQKKIMPLNKILVDIDRPKIFENVITQKY